MSTLRTTLLVLAALLLCACGDDKTKTVYVEVPRPNLIPRLVSVPEFLADVGANADFVVEVCNTGQVASAETTATFSVLMTQPGGNEWTVADLSATVPAIEPGSSASVPVSLWIANEATYTITVNVAPVAEELWETDNLAVFSVYITPTVVSGAG